MVNNKKKYNFVYICLDGARNYPSPWSGKTGGGCGKPEIFDEFAKEAIDFKTAVCAAPSTLMSFSSTFSGFPCGYLARNFMDFKFDHLVFDSLIKILKMNNYQIYTLDEYEYARKVFKEMYFPIDQKYYPKDLREDKTWSNEEVLSLFDNLTKQLTLRTPFSLLVHINVRFDRNISQKVAHILNYLKKINVYDDSIIILCSDHGCPDPERNISNKLLREIGHDLILTDDNILFAFCMKYPGCSPKSIKTAVSSLDIMPTVLDLLGFSYENKIGIPLKGKSLLPLIEGENTKAFDDRIMLTEARFISQPFRRVSLRGNDFKYIYFYDEEEECFYDLRNDPKEENNVIESTSPDVQKTIQRYREEFKRYETDMLRFQHKYLLHSFQKEFDRLVNENTSLKNSHNILIFGSSDVEFAKALVTGINQRLPKANIYMISVNNIKRRDEMTLVKSELFSNDNFENNARKITEWCHAKIPDGVDTVFLLVDGSSKTDVIKKMQKTAKKISNKIVYINYNMEMNMQLKRRKISFGSNPDIPLFLRRVYKWIGFHYYRRKWYKDDIKLTLNRWIPFLHLKTLRKE